eukprot:EG_transcript_1662
MPANQGCSNAVEVSCGTSVVDTLALAIHIDSPSPYLKHNTSQMWYTIASAANISVRVSGVTAPNMNLAVWADLNCSQSTNVSYLAGDSVTLSLSNTTATRYHLMVYGTTNPFNLLVTCNSVPDTVGTAGCRNVQASVTTDLWPTQVSWYISPSIPIVYGGGYKLSNTVFTRTVCLPPGNYTFQALDSNGNGWTTGGFQVALEGFPLINFTNFSGAYLLVPFDVLKAPENCGCNANAQCMTGLNDTRFCSCNPGYLGDGNTSCVVDECASATAILCGNGLKSSTTAGDFIPRRIAGVAQTAPSRWFYVDVRSAGIALTVTTCSRAAFPHLLSVFGSPACPSLAPDVVTTSQYEQTCPGGSGWVASWTASAAGRYYLMVHGKAGAVGNFTIQLACVDTQEVPCYDLNGWTDRNGFGCQDYTDQGWCENGWYGPNWDRSWGFFSKYAAAGSAGADAACCDCGKWREPANTTAAADCALSDWGAWSSCAAVDDVACGST